MSFTSPKTWVANAKLLASQLNEQIRDNLLALWVGTTAGDMDYYATSTSKGRIGIPTNYKGRVMGIGSDSLPAWGGMACFSLSNSGTQSIASSTLTALTFDTEEFDDYGFFPGSGAVITPPTDMTGYYVLFGSVSLAASTLGYISVNIYAGEYVLGSFTLDGHLSSGTHDLVVFGFGPGYSNTVAPNYSPFSLKIFQNSGGSLNATLARFSGALMYPASLPAS